MTSAAEAGARIGSLDGLRGIAALVVLAHHTLLVLPSLAGGYFGQPPTALLPRLLLYTPLHLVWAGREAVFLFFVLSGLVLARAARSPEYDWGRYFPARLVRLYLPVAGAVLLAFLNYLLVPRTAYPGESAWMMIHPADFPPAVALHNIVLITGTTTAVSPLWSLQWEVLFSLLLPLYMFVTRRINPWLQVSAALVLVALGNYSGVVALQFLPMFAVGCVLGSQWSAISEFLLTLANRALAKIGWPALVVVALVLIVSGWLLPGSLSSLSLTLTIPVVLIGVTALILAAAFWPPLARLLSLRPFRWLGLISFSLYLVHEPIVVALAEISHGAVWVVFVAPPLALGVAAAFYWLVERPTLRLTRLVRSGRTPPPNPPAVPRTPAGRPAATPAAP